MGFDLNVVFLKDFVFYVFSKLENQDDELEQIAAQEQKIFKFQTLVSATKNFHPNHKLGQGGYGPVFKGKLEDGREIAVKKLSQSSSQGNKEFTNEAKLLARVQHRNVVTLLGYCANPEKLLVYEYVVNESLDKLLFNVYSFGVVVLELISGQRNSSFNLDPEYQNLLDWAYKLYKKGKSLEILESTLASSADPDQVSASIQIALLCTQSDPQLRPTMRRVVVMLTKKPSQLDEPTRPGIPAGTSSTFSHSSMPTTTSTATPVLDGSQSAHHHRPRTSVAVSSISDPYGKRPMKIQD
ncbi:Concanavalin A-like lectin/glucanase, subgroup [Artemisia annua]|uniref:Concanavalin A-like lectin/glucanase, subgroup n=1 Tax=Artemisia annua TaxID=35608 RepID=A0A2U1NSD5_ARTAN|nr:Concanavalin A-like lectin/glucanase, subgroup [Artemisia annua]